jgi:hypothetical protein
MQKVDRQTVEKLFRNYSIIPVRENKAPYLNEWTKACKKRIAKDHILQADYVGIACGFEGLEVLDIDNHFGDAEILLSYVLGQLEWITELKLPINKTGGGGYHILYKCNKPSGNAKLAQRFKADGKKDTLIETRGMGGQIVYYPDTMEQGNDILTGEVAKISDAQKEELWQFCKSLNETASAEVKQTTNSQQEGRPGDIYNTAPDVREKTIDLLESNGWTAADKEKTYWIRPGKDSGVSASLGRVFKDNNPKNKELYFYVFSSNADPFEDGKLYSPMGVLATLGYNGNYAATAASLGGGEKTSTTKKGRGAQKWEQLALVLKDWKIKFKYNVITRVLEPSMNGKEVDSLSLLLGDISKEMEMNRGVNNIGKAKLIEMIESSLSESYNPIRDFFKSLPKWDGKDTFSDLMKYIDIGEAEDEVYFKTMLKKHLIRAIRCSLQNEYTNRMALVFHGPQEIGKSKFWQWLVPPTLYTEEPVDPTSKDSVLSLARYLFVNLEELDSMQKKEMNKIKAFISRSGITARVAYGRTDEKFARIASFVGSTNDSDILADDTNTRWIFLIVKKFDWRGYLQNINPLQLWAQAMHELKADNDAGELTIEEKKIREERNNTEFLGQSQEREMLQQHFEYDEHAIPMTMTQIKRLIELTQHPIRLNEWKFRHELKRLYGFPRDTSYKGKSGRYYFLKTDLRMPGVMGFVPPVEETVDDSLPF